MGRLHHLSQTLPFNLNSTASHPDCEFIILNYGSQDGLHEWAKQNLRPWIDAGIVKYYRTQQPEYFIATHAKNVAQLQATGDILCNVDADNFILPGFAEYLENIFKTQSPCVVASPSVDANGNAGSCGKIAVLREHFHSVNGYDEDWTIGWGWDDTNFQFRTRMHNNLKYVQMEEKWCVVIGHSNEERVANFRDKDIFKTRDLSEARLKEIAHAQDYVANKGRVWGLCPDLSADLS